MSRKLGKLTDIHYRAMKLRFDGLTIRQIAQEIGKSERAVAMWFGEDDLFKKEFNSMRDEAIERARDMLFSYAPNAAGNLIMLASGEGRGRGGKIVLDANIDILNRIGLKAPDKQEIEMSERVVIVNDLDDLEDGGDDGNSQN